MRIVKETRALVDDRYAHAFMLTEQMSVGVQKEREKRLQAMRKENASHMVFALALVISSHPYIFCLFIRSL
jgi:hypothetical protein